jgi:heme oxygenase
MLRKAPGLAVRELSGTRMQQLREATRSAHERIERAMPLMDPDLSRVRYVRLLQSSYGFYAPLEPLCTRAAGPLGAALALSTRAKTPLIIADLCALGHAESDTRKLPLCQALPKVTSSSRAMGVFYVLEGATLGAQIIRRHLQSTLGVDAGSGASFFVGYGDRTREMWTRFAGQVDSVAGLDLDAAIDAAVETFETFERWTIASLASP